MRRLVFIFCILFALLATGLAIHAFGEDVGVVFDLLFGAVLAAVGVALSAEFGPRRSFVPQYFGSPYREPSTSTPKPCRVGRPSPADNRCTCSRRVREGSYAHRAACPCWTQADTEWCLAGWVPEPPAPVKLRSRVFPSAALALLLLTTAGCAAGLDGYRQGLTHASSVGAATATTLKGINEHREAEFAARAAEPGVNVEKLRAEVTEYRTRYDAARAGLAAFDLSLTAAENAIALADADTRTTVDVGAVVGRLVTEALALHDRIAALVAVPAPAAGGVR